MHHVELVVDRDDVSELPLLDEELEGLLSHALNQVRPEGDDSWQISVLFTTDDRIQSMHAEFMGIDTPTDIMTFPYEVDEYAPAGFADLGGDLVISVETAAANAVEAGWSTQDELQYLALHGLLHLLGWNDTTPEERAAMLQEQDALLASWREAG
jgi:rRNA maturation RNase YbeY